MAGARLPPSPARSLAAALGGGAPAGRRRSRRGSSPGSRNRRQERARRSRSRSSPPPPIPFCATTPAPRTAASRAIRQAVRRSDTATPFARHAASRRPKSGTVLLRRPERQEHLETSRHPLPSEHGVPGHSTHELRDSEAKEALLESSGRALHSRAAVHRSTGAWLAPPHSMRSSARPDRHVNPRGPGGRSASAASDLGLEPLTSFAERSCRRTPCSVSVPATAAA